MRERDRSLQACRSKIAKQKARLWFWNTSRGLCKIHDKFWGLWIRVLIPGVLRYNDTHLFITALTLTSSQRLFYVPKWNQIGGIFSRDTRSDMQSLKPVTAPRCCICLPLLFLGSFIIRIHFLPKFSTKPHKTICIVSQGHIHSANMKEKRRKTTSRDCLGWYIIALCQSKVSGWTWRKTFECVSVYNLWQPFEKVKLPQ